MLNKSSAVLLTALAAGLLAAPAHAQFSVSTGFDQTYPGTGGTSGSIETPFIFSVPGASDAASTKNNNSSEANSNYNVTFDHSGYSTLNNGYPYNLASVVINNGGASGDYTLTTTVNTNYAADSGYPFAGLIVFDSASSYVEFGDEHNGYQSSANTFALTQAKLPGIGTAQTSLKATYTPLGNGTSGTGVAAGTTTPSYVTLSIVKSGTTINFSYIPTTGGLPVTSYSVSAASTGNDLIAYNYLNDINGKRVGLYTEDASYSGDQSTVNFGSFSANVSALAAAPEPSAWVSMAIGILGVSLLSIRARRRLA